MTSGPGQRVSDEPPGGNGRLQGASRQRPRAPGPAQGASRATALTRWLIGPILAAAGGLLWLAPAPVDPVEPAIAGPPRRFELQPRRPILSDPPVITVGSFEQRCDECHRLFQTPPEGRRLLLAHQHIEFSHGLNDRCFNCHDRDRRQRLALRDGSTVGFAESSRQCAQCHGAAFRDWQRGAHGKTVGSWQAGDERRRKLQCVECHDPHAPAYAPLAPLPAPATLRMGDQSHAGHGPSRSPLQRGQRAHSPSHDLPHESADPHDTADTRDRDQRPPAATHEEPAP